MSSRFLRYALILPLLLAASAHAQNPGGRRDGQGPGGPGSGGPSSGGPGSRGPGGPGTPGKTLGPPP